MSKNISTEIFIAKSIEFHGNKYIYLKSTYVNSRTKICIICPTHGEFYQLPNVHYRSGCLACGHEVGTKKRSLTTQEFIDKSNIIHNSKYEYNNTYYINYSMPVIIKCPIHKYFLQKPAEHLNGYGCQKCGVEKYSEANRKTLSEFIKDSSATHGNKYDYSLVDYVNNETKVCIICVKHNLKFYQTPHCHISQKSGCTKCKGEILSQLFKYSTEEFINLANKIHNFKYDYSVTSYLGIFDNVNITCKKHGEFVLTADHHLRGRGCQACGCSTSNQEQEWLEYLNIPLDYRQKTLVFNNRIIRTDACDETNKIVYEFYGDYWHGNQNKYKPNDIHSHLNKPFIDIFNLTIEREQFLTDNGYKVISIWESDWILLKKGLNNGVLFKSPA
jgi:hypothetical protein